MRVARGGGPPAPAELGIAASGEAATAAAAAAAAVAAAVAEEDEDGVMERAGEGEPEVCLGVPWAVLLGRPGVPSPLLFGRITRDSQPGDTCSRGFWRDFQA